MKKISNPHRIIYTQPPPPPLPQNTNFVKTSKKLLKNRIELFPQRAIPRQCQINYPPSPPPAPQNRQSMEDKGKNCKKAFSIK